MSAAETLLARLDRAIAAIETDPGRPCSSHERSDASGHTVHGCGGDPEDSIEDPLRLLQAAARVLLGLAGKAPAADLLVSVGPEHLLGVRLRHVDGELHADLVRAPADRSDPVVLDLTPDPQATVSTLASMLWSGELGSGGPPVALPSNPQETGPL